MGRRNRPLKEARERVGTGSTFLAVFRMALSNSKMSPGNMVNTQIMLISTPFASTSPKSMPMRKLMNTSMSSPTTVVMPLLRMDEKGVAQRALHGEAPVVNVGAFLPVPVRQDDGIIHRQHQL